MAHTSVAAATEQERLVGGADVDSDGLQESYGDDDDDDDDDDHVTTTTTMTTTATTTTTMTTTSVAAGGWRGAKSRPRAPPVTPARCRRPSS